MTRSRFRRSRRCEGCEDGHIIEIYAHARNGFAAYGDCAVLAFLPYSNNFGVKSVAGTSPSACVHWTMKPSCKIAIRIYEGENANEANRGYAETDNVLEKWPIKDEEEYK